jgi:ABC-type hemin transport system ATPase subunit
MEKAKIPVNELASRQSNLARQIETVTSRLEQQRIQMERVKRVQQNWQALQEHRAAMLNVGTAATAQRNGSWSSAPEDSQGLLRPPDGHD